MSYFANLWREPVFFVFSVFCLSLSLSLHRSARITSLYNFPEGFVFFFPTFSLGFCWALVLHTFEMYLREVILSYNKRSLTTTSVPNSRKLYKNKLELNFVGSMAKKNTEKLRKLFSPTFCAKTK